jgi:hypothetical protein
MARKSEIRKPNYFVSELYIRPASVFDASDWICHGFISIYVLHAPIQEGKEHLPVVDEMMMNVGKTDVITSLTGPFTFLIIDRVGSSRNSTLTWMTFPVFPVLPRTRLTLASLTG